MWSRSAAPTVTITVDVHESDPAQGIDRCSETLAERGLTATFFVPTALLRGHRLTPALRRLGTSPHVIGSHGHRHDLWEQLALRSSEGGRAFLTESLDRFQQFYERPAEFFRSPCWCKLSDEAFAALADLGYRVDCSSTPGRPGVLSSELFSSPWLRSPRAPYFVCRSLLEVPTSCLLVPLASPTFLTLRRRGSLAFFRVLAWEAAIWPTRVVNLVLHTGDFLDDWVYGRLPFKPLDLVPRRYGGLAWRRFLQTSDAKQTAACIDAVIASLGRVTTLREIYDRYASVLMAVQPGDSDSEARHRSERSIERSALQTFADPCQQADEVRPGQ